MNHLKESTRTFLTPTNKKNNPKMGQTGQSIKNRPELEITQHLLSCSGAPIRFDWIFKKK